MLGAQGDLLRAGTCSYNGGCCLSGPQFLSLKAQWARIMLGLALYEFGEFPAERQRKMPPPPLGNTVWFLELLFPGLLLESLFFPVPCSWGWGAGSSKF